MLQEKTQLERTIQTPRRTLNTKIVGKSAVKIAEMAGFSVPSATRALVAQADGVGPEYPISMEKLSPTLGFYSVKDWQEGCAKCIEILNFGGLGHTLSLHTKNDEIVRQFGLAQARLSNLREHAGRAWRRWLHDESVPGDDARLRRRRRQHHVG